MEELLHLLRVHEQQQQKEEDDDEEARRNRHALNARKRRVRKRQKFEHLARLVHSPSSTTQDQVITAAILRIESLEKERRDLASGLKMALDSLALSLEHKDKKQKTEPVEVILDSHTGKIRSCSSSFIDFLGWNINILLADVALVDLCEFKSANAFREAMQAIKNDGGGGVECTCKLVMADSRMAETLLQITKDEADHVCVVTCRLLRVLEQ